ncbi:Hypothetical protein, conserved [Brucella abortus str. 2308 A]|uniref:Uncharacterized protein n=2 Tax=Brucella TaxID=234 RepID=A9M911_BRUC2|nr:Hypothetical protein, conserved [Brucella canis ATCC 23365]ADZ86449.1 conserved hypothetical protein [Brucella melitensis M5-90]EEH15693.1 Hypothetical protein, conserved [Brucella ceti str. Cudo]EEP64003.1 Hypothetical protein, conserved [Brucella abortus str. 2308 A]
MQIDKIQIKFDCPYEMNGKRFGLFCAYETEI